MTTHELFTAIESAETEIRANAASDLRTFRRALGDVEAFRQLSNVASQTKVQGQIARRFVDRSRKGGDDRFRHRFDVALAAYLLLLSDRSSQWVRPLNDIANDVPNTWWLKKAVTEASPSRPHTERFLAAEPTHAVVYDSNVSFGPSLVATLALSPHELDEPIVVFSSSDQWSTRVSAHAAYVRGEIGSPVSVYTTPRRWPGAWHVRIAADSPHFEGLFVEENTLFPYAPWYTDSTMRESANVEIDA